MTLCHPLSLGSVRGPNQELLQSDLSLKYEGFVIDLGCCPSPILLYSLSNGNDSFPLPNANSAPDYKLKESRNDENPEGGREDGN